MSVPNSESGASSQSLAQAWGHEYRNLRLKAPPSRAGASRAAGLRRRRIARHGADRPLVAIGPSSDVVGDKSAALAGWTRLARGRVLSRLELEFGVELRAEQD